MRILELKSLILPEIMDIDRKDIPKFLKMASNTFANLGMGPESIKEYIRLVTDWTISKQLVYKDKTIGVILLRPENIENIIESDYTLYCDLDKFNNKRGAQVIALIILPKYRNKETVEILKSVPKILGFDYIFGEQLKTLNNLLFLFRFKELIAEDFFEYITAEFI